MSAKKRPPKRVRQAQAQVDRYDDVIRHQVYLERFKTALVNDFDRAILQIEDEISATLGKFKTPDLSDLNRTELNGLLNSLRKIENQGYAAQLDRLSGQLESLGDYSATREAAQLTNWAAKTAEAASITTPSAASVWQFVQNQPIAATGQLVGDFLIDYKDKAISRMEGAVRNGWAQGKTTGDLIREFRGTKAKNFKDGLLRGADKRTAEAIVRTSVQHVANTARQKTWEENKDVVQGYMWISTLDGLTTSTCRSLDRQRFKLGRGPIPPIHVNCRSTTIADLGEKWDFLNEGATRSSANGYVPADKSYYEWLKTQDPEFVKDALGAKRAQLFMKGGLSADEFAKLNLGKNFEPLSLAEMQKRDAAAFKRAGVDVRGKGGPGPGPGPSESIKNFGVVTEGGVGGKQQVFLKTVDGETFVVKIPRDEASLQRDIEMSKLAKRVGVSDVVLEQKFGRATINGVDRDVLYSRFVGSTLPEDFLERGTLISKYSEADKTRLAAFELLTNSADRNLTNYLYSEKIIGIDYELSFLSKHVTMEGNHFLPMVHMKDLGVEFAGVKVQSGNADALVDRTLLKSMASKSSIFADAAEKVGGKMARAVAEERAALMMKLAETEGLTQQQLIDAYRELGGKDPTVQ